MLGNLKYTYLEDFITVNENKIYFLKKLFHGVSMGNLTKTFNGGNNDVFEATILFLKEITIFKE